ncbi:MAG: paraquat-inducible protein A, partial [Verrucomicrobiaceae bacterium]|nr:paraquat-inducible protein A [Verrucomicrobiaceae bacterium]
DKWIMFLRAVSRYAMLEVFLVALTVLLIKEMPGGSRITLQSGFYTFSTSVLLSLFTAHWMERINRH